MKAEVTTHELKALKGAFDIVATLPMNETQSRIFKVGHDFVQRKLREIELKTNNERSAWEVYAPHYGFKPTDLRRQFMLKNRRYEIIGINPHAPRFAIQAKRLPDGKQFRVPPDCVKRGLI